MSKRSVAVALALAFTFSAPMAASALPPAEMEVQPTYRDPNAAPPSAVAIDVILVRPISLVGSIVSTAVFVGTSPLTWMTGLSGPALQILVEAPWKFTANRYVGHWSRYKGDPPNTSFASY